MGKRVSETSCSGLSYSTIQNSIVLGDPKVGSQVQASTLERLTGAGGQLGVLTCIVSYSDLSEMCPNFPSNTVFVSGTAYNWFPAWRDIPETTTERGRPSLPARTIGYKFDPKKTLMSFSRSCAVQWATGGGPVASDGFNLKKWLLERFPRPSRYPTEGEI